MNQANKAKPGPVGAVMCKCDNRTFISSIVALRSCRYHRKIRMSRNSHMCACRECIAMDKMISAGMSWRGLRTSHMLKNALSCSVFTPVHAHFKASHPCVILMFIIMTSACIFVIRMLATTLAMHTVLSDSMIDLHGDCSPALDQTSDKI